MSYSRSFRYLIILSAIVSVFIGLRFVDIGKDTQQYLQHFTKYSTIDKVLDGYEIGFSIIMYLFSKYTSSVELFFFFISFLITTMYLYFFKKIYLRTFCDESFRLSKSVFFFSLLLLSSWYFTMATNGIRQGVSLVFLYHSLYELFYNSKKFKFIIFFVLSLCFHYSAVVVLPFLILKYVKFRVAFVIWIVTALGYVFGFNELIVRWLSDMFSLPVYDFIKFYSLERGQIEGGLYNGFILYFFLYTVFWPLLFMLIIKVKISAKSSALVLKDALVLLKIYFALSMPYFIFGFGPFSNRYAMLAWFLVPIMQFHIINSINIKNIPRVFSLAYILLIFLNFLFFTLDWIRLLK